MVKVVVTDTAGEERTIEAEEGISLMESIRENDFDDLPALCGGCCSCCTCHVYVETSWAEKMPTMEDDESYLLEDSPHFKGGESRLSCQIEINDTMDGLKVTIAPED
ncbi:2Fe-2S iron-sulfur cluster-binding protein [Temperatibacter marinus]|uniref:2Fe-2S iron-sulfur cluster-binding protein n=1 Tax=Temperatibacter marinus TaxID=1456591 RepID=A0AA52EIV5_9PROT|nr:2Fe-2S iron-sulfur cluster-binding protein [Temperatibacter marinus]WND03319.1 2Fe-2S iron-sulfur cluster-binding protein [Temperatibacter marinus]